MTRRISRVFVIAAAAGSVGALTSPVVAGAQVVGRLPENAIMTDLFDGQRIGPFGGWLATGSDPVGVGANSGPIAGVRYTVPMAGPMYFAARVFGVATDHNVMLPNASAANRRAGTASGNQLGFDVGFELALTGRRAWHGVQPLLTAGVGVIAGVGNQFDAGGYSPGASGLYSYGLAARFPTGQSGELRADVGWMIHQVRYPSAFRTTHAGDDPPLRATGSLTPLTSNRAMTLSWTWGVFR